MSAPRGSFATGTRLSTGLAAALAGLALAGACSGGDDGDGDGSAGPDAANADPDAAVAVDASVAIDAAQPVFATFHIPAGAHGATISGGGEGNPVRNFTDVEGRDYLFAFDATAEYEITNPEQPGDQLDWNKLPGLSDCTTIDLSVNGLMFGWRWRLDTNPRVLEVTAYANNDRTHLWLNEPLFTLSAAELAADEPLRYRLWLDGNRYRFTVQGTIGGRTIDVAAEHPRACPATSMTGPKWAGQFYFGGTSTAPQVITARISERPFVR